MKTLRRYDFKNRDYFITAVAFNRQNILVRDVDLFRKSWRIVRPMAWVILPDHFHVVVSSGEVGISTLLHRFKITYSRVFRNEYDSGRVWQNRFWDHLIRDHDDLHRHLDYIHYNPVKHGLVSDPFAYEYSSLRSYFKMGYYDRDWGVREDVFSSTDFGE